MNTKCQSYQNLQRYIRTYEHFKTVLFWELTSCGLAVTIGLEAGSTCCLYFQGRTLVLTILILLLEVGHNFSVVRVPGYTTKGPGSIPGTTRLSEKQWVWNRVHSASLVQSSYLEEIVVALA
jgi:hypothetical protein